MNYKFDSIVNKTEANALKEMIFRRVRERLEDLAEDVQDDVMNIARESFVSKNNPFSQIINTPVENKKVEKQAEKPEIGFPQKELNPRAIEETRVIKEQILTATVQSTMNDARNTLNNKKSFVGALDFLNSQAAASLLRTRSDKFEALA